MFFDYGTNRYVIGIGGIVIKIAILWPHPPVWINLYSKYLIRGDEYIGKKVTALKKNPLKVISRHFFGGVLSNLEERKRYKNNPNEPIAPTLFTFFGIINIQLRAEPICFDELSDCPFREMSHLDKDLRNPKHFGRINGRIVLLDYGLDPLRSLIDQENSEIQLMET